MNRIFWSFSLTLLALLMGGQVQAGVCTLEDPQMNITVINGFLKKNATTQKRLDTFIKRSGFGEDNFKNARDNIQSSVEEKLAREDF